MIETLQALGSQTAWIVHGDDGTDEVSITGPTQVAALEGENVRLGELNRAVGAGLDGAIRRLKTALQRPNCCGSWRKPVSP